MTRKLVGSFMVLVASIAAGGCAAGDSLRIHDALERPPGTPAAVPAGTPAAAVFDFAFSGTPSQEVGRDYFGVRPIVWEGSPGRAMADLVARILAEKGIRAVRVTGGEVALADAIPRITGTIDEFRVDGRRVDMVTAEDSARVVLSLSAAAPGRDAPFTTHLSADNRVQEALWVTARGVQSAMNGAANAAAEEAVRRLVAAGIVTEPAAPAGGESPPAGGGVR